MSERLLHLYLQQTQQQLKEVRLVEFGHIASFDPASYAVKVIFPALQDVDNNPILSGWLPLGSGWVGNGFGAFFHPHGGATFEHPNQGEEVVVVVAEREQGVSAIANLLFNDTMQPPAANTQPGDYLLRHESGSFLHFKSTGDVHLTTQHDLIATVGHDADVMAVNSANVTSPAINLGNGGTLEQLLNDHAKGTFNGHTHTDPQGGVTSSPNQQMSAADETQVVKAE